MKTIIHVNRNVIQHNTKHGDNIPVCRVQIGGKQYYGSSVKINGPSEMVYRPEKPLSCGAKLWIETNAEVEIIGQVEWAAVRHRMEKNLL
jgi:hypothetical protein